MPLLLPLLPSAPIWSAPLCLAATPVGQTGSPFQWGAIVMAVLTIVYVLFRSGRKKKADPMNRPPGQASLAQQRNVERQMQNLLVELSEMARQITAQLDTRSTKLALMIDDADEKAARLQKLLDDCRDALAASPPPLAAPPPMAARPALLDAPAFEPSLELANASDARHQQVYALADQGRSASDIARQIDRPSGEVELILALRPR